MVEVVNQNSIRGVKGQGQYSVLPFLFLSFGNHRLSDHLPVAE